jgi:hypothetical protein
VSGALRQWAVLTVPSRLLTVVDVSGSMDFTDAGQSRISLAVTAANGALQLFPDSITSIVGLQEGAFVATTKAVYWLSGDRPENWARRVAYMMPIIPDGIVVPGEELPAAETAGPVAIFASAQGLLLGRPDGTIRPLTQGSYHFSASRVAMTWRSEPLRQLFIATND